MNTTITGTIESVERRQNTPNGNPRWAIRVNGKTYNTKDDTACAHIPDLWDAMSRVTLTLDGRKQIVGYELS